MTTVRQRFKERLKELAREKGRRFGEKTHPSPFSFADLVNYLNRTISAKLEETLERQTEGLLNAYLAVVSELLLFHLRNTLTELAEEKLVLGALDDKDIRAALISFLDNAWDKKIESKILQLKSLPPNKRQELKAKFIERLVSRFVSKGE